MSDEENNVGVSFTATTEGLEAGAKRASDAINSVSSGTAAGMNNASYATAGTTREFIVLGHEIISGNFSRIPGSLMVMAERMGSLPTIVESLKDSFVAAGLAITAAILAMGEASLKASESMGQIQISLQTAGNASLFSEDQINKYTDGLSKMAGVSKGDAREAFAALSASAHITQENFDSLYKMLPDIAAGMKTDIPTAVKDMAEAMREPQKAIDDLIKRTGDLDPATEKLYLKFKDTNDVANEQALLLSLLAKNYGGMEGQVVSLTKNFWNLWDSIVGVNEELTKGQRIEAAFGSKAAAPQLAKEGQQAVDDMRKQNAQQIVQFKQLENDQISKGLQLEDQLNQKKGEQLKLEGQIAQFQSAANSAGLKGDSKDQQKFLNDAKMVQDQITANNKKALAEQVRDFEDAEHEKIRSAMTEASEGYSLAQEQIRIEVEAGRMSAQQELAALNAAQQAKYNIQMNALNAEIKIGNLSVTEAKRVKDEINKVTQQDTLERVKNEKAALDTMTRENQQYANAIKNGLDGALRGMLNGTQNWKQSIANIFEDLLIGKLNTMIDLTTKAWNDSEATKTGATNVGNAARTASNTAANTTSLASTFSTYVASIEADAAKTYASVFAFMSPVMGPFAAIPAGVAAALVGGMSALVPHFDVGTNFVPNDMLAMVHKGERIIPAADNAALMQGMSGGGAGGSGGGVNIHFHGPVYGLRDFNSAVAQAVASSVRSANPNLTRNFR